MVLARPLLMQRESQFYVTLTLDFDDTGIFCNKEQQKGESRHYSGIRKEENTFKGQNFMVLTKIKD